MRNRYFQDELNYLRESGNEFAEYFPKLTKYLSSRSTDPDVERMLEGFAFLTAKLREKIDDQIPEVTQTLLQLLWPNFLRPIPSMTILQFDPVPGSINQRQVMGKGTSVNSVPVEGTICRFRSTSDLVIHPLKISKIRHDSSKEASTLTLNFETLNDEPIEAIGLQDLRLYFGGTDYSAQLINLYIHRYLDDASLSVSGGGEAVSIRRDSLKQGGLGKNDAVIPYPDNSFVGYRLLQEYYTLPQKFYFLDLCNLPFQSVAQGRTGFQIIFRLSRPLPPDVRVGENAFMLHCVPAVNLFDYEAEPVQRDGRRSEFILRPNNRIPGEIDIFSVESVSGWTPTPGNSDGKTQVYHRFESFSHESERAENRHIAYFRERVGQSLAGDRLDRFLTFIREDETVSIKQGETISIGLLCTNGRAPSHLAVGDVKAPDGQTPSYALPHNITRPTGPQYPVVDGTLHWQLISSLSLNYISLQSTEALRTILLNFDFGAKADRQSERASISRLQGITALHSSTVDRLFRGRPVRGMRTNMSMKESRFSSEGDMYLFATVLAEFFGLYATINSFHELIVHGLEAGEEYRWTPRIGNQPLI